MRNPASALRAIVCSAALGLAGLLAVPVAAAEQPATCQDWFAGRPVDAGYGEPAFWVIAPELACFDGRIEQTIEQPVLDWIKTPAQGKKVLGVRSTGGDAAVGLAIAEAMQVHGVEVAVTQLCGSSCANYLYAGAPSRTIEDGALLLYHGGYSPQMRERALVEIDRLFSSPQGQLIGDKDANRAAALADFDRKTQRQAALYKANGVDERVILGVDALDRSQLDPDLCGGDTQKPRNFLFFSREQLRALGLEARQGAPSEDPVFINKRLAEMGRNFVACRAPADFLSMKL